MLYFCPSCGERVDSDEMICKGCGSLSSKVKEEILAANEKENYDSPTIGFKDGNVTCSSCKRQADEEDNYCRYCGTKLK